MDTDKTIDVIQLQTSIFIIVISFMRVMEGGGRCRIRSILEFAYMLV